MGQREDRSTLGLVPGVPWAWHLCGAIAALFIAMLALGVVAHAFPLPRISAGTFLLAYLGAAALSVVAGLKASRWWFALTACFAVLVVLLWVAEYMFESR